MTDERTKFVLTDEQLLNTARVVGVNAEECTNPLGIYVVTDVPDHDCRIIGPRWEPHINHEQCDQVLAKLPSESWQEYLEAVYDALGYDDESASETMWEFWLHIAPPDIRMKALCKVAEEWWKNEKDRN